MRATVRPPSNQGRTVKSSYSRNKLETIRAYGREDPQTAEEARNER